jgi:hypothetical protein
MPSVIHCQMRDVKAFFNNSEVKTKVKLQLSQGGAPWHRCRDRDGD